MNIEQNNEPVKHEDLHEQIKRMGDALDESYVCAVLVGDVKLQPGRISIRSSSGIYIPDDMVMDEQQTTAVFAGMITDSMFQNKQFADVVMLAVSMYAEDRMHKQSKINLN